MRAIRAIRRFFSRVWARIWAGITRPHTDTIVGVVMGAAIGRIIMWGWVLGGLLVAGVWGAAVWAAVIIMLELWMNIHLFQRLAQYFVLESKAREMLSSNGNSVPHPAPVG